MRTLKNFVAGLIVKHSGIFHDAALLVPDEKLRQEEEGPVEVFALRRDAALADRHGVDGAEAHFLREAARTCLHRGARRDRLVAAFGDRRRQKVLRIFAHDSPEKKQTPEGVILPGFDAH